MIKRKKQWLKIILKTIVSTGMTVQIDVVDESQQSSWNIWSDLMEQRSGAYVLKKDSQNLPLQFLIAAHKPEV